MLTPDTFAGFTAEHCNIAWKTIVPSFEKAYNGGLLNKLAGTIVVLRPAGQTGMPTKPNIRLWLAEALMWAEENLDCYNNPSLKELASRVLFIGCVGDEPEAKYTYFALMKALVAERIGMSSGDIGTVAPWLMQPGDCKFRGAAHENGLTIGFSGVQAVYDEAFAFMMLVLIQAMLREEYAVLMADGDKPMVPHP